MDTQDYTTEHRKGQHLLAEERHEIEVRRKDGWSIYRIAKHLNRPYNTIKNEIARGTVYLYNGKVARYKAKTGEQQYRENRRNSRRQYKRLAVSSFIKYVEEKFEKGWSLDVCAGKALESGKFRRDQIVCTKTLYNYVDNGLIGIKNIDLPEKLKRNTKKEKVRKNKRILGDSIELRPESVELREEFGHWEADTVLGSKYEDEPCTVTLVERKTRKAIWIKAADHTADSVQAAIQSVVAYFGSMAQAVFKTVTCDNGSEFSRLAELATQGTSVYFISTIVTYTDNRPHDSHYFHNPDAIISGEPRTPWIDVANNKLVYRHFGVICTTEFFDNLGMGPDEVGICDFFTKHYTAFETFISGKTESDFDLAALIPPEITFSLVEFKNDFLGRIRKLKEMVEEFPEEYRNDDNTEQKVLDVFLESGIFPTYSFPKDVVGFHVEDYNGSQIKEKPDRALEMAISEYAPGRIVVINKTTYVSGGIYSFHSKFRSDEQEHPARPYFESAEYYKRLFYCSNHACNWMGLEYQSVCPFCGKDTIEEQNLLKPWGFAPLGGASTKESDAEAEMTYAEDPSYSITPAESEMCVPGGFDNLRYSKRSNDPLIILNKGPKGKGFMVCKDCGASVPGDDEAALRKIPKPYRHPHKRYECHHPNGRVVNTYLGNQFRTDMVVYEITLDSEQINVDTSGLWIRRAGQTLAEAMTLAGGRLLDIEFSEIKSGYRLRYSPSEKKTFVDIFLFDSLSSGAGYCSALAERTRELMAETRKVLSECSADCDSACHECLMHYWNQRVHSLLDRFAALELLNWCESSVLPEPLSYEEQNKLLEPLNALDADFTIVGDGKHHFIMCDGHRQRIYAYPSMWSEFSDMLPEDAITLSDKMLKYALPMADAKIRSMI